MSAPLYATAPICVTAEQFLASKSAMAITTLLNKFTDYTVTPNTVAGTMQSLTVNDRTYVMHDTDWVVVGPNIEVIYTNTQFLGLFTAISAPGVTFALGADNLDTMEADLNVYCSGVTAGNTVDIDWGDGSTHGSITPAAGTSVNPISHTYALPDFYQITVTLLSGTTLLSMSTGTFNALPLPPSTNDLDLPDQLATDVFNADTGAPSAALMMTGVAVMPPLEATDMPDVITSRVVSVPSLPGQDVQVIGAGSGVLGSYSSAEMARVEAGLPPNDISDQDPSPMQE